MRKRVIAEERGYSDDLLRQFRRLSKGIDNEKKQLYNSGLLRA
jgi:hypothetical protein